MRGISSREALLSTWPIASRSAIFRRPRPQTGCWAISKADLSSAQSKNLFILSDEEISSPVLGPPNTALPAFSAAASVTPLTPPLAKACPRVGSGAVISAAWRDRAPLTALDRPAAAPPIGSVVLQQVRSEEHTSELQSRLHLVCR